MAYIGNTATTQAFTPAVDYFNGDGSTVAFTLSKPVASVAQVQAVIENVPQNPGSAYTVSGNTITFTSAPPSGTANIYVYYTSPITQVIAPSQGTVGSSQLQSNLALTGSLTVDGTTLVVDDTNNRVGIGTSSPTQPLQINMTTGDQGIKLQAHNTTAGNRLSFADSSGTEYGLVNYDHAQDHMSFYTNSTEQMRITSDGYLRMASGTGGIQFGGDTAAANALDDYEEGTFTPVLDGTSGASPVVSYSVRSGYYTKIGNVVNASLYITVSSISGGSGNIRISGLPFTVANNSNNNGICTIIMSGIDIPTGVSYVGLYTNPNTTEVRPLCTVDSSGWIEIPISAVSSGDSFLIGATYFA